MGAADLPPQHGFHLDNFRHGQVVYHYAWTNCTAEPVGRLLLSVT